MSDLRVSDLATRTGLSMRYWQRRIAAGHVPGCRELPCGKRRMFLISSESFDAWWERETKPICQKTSESAAESGGIGSAKTAKIRKARLTPKASQSLVNDLKKFVDA